jgi:hypothetical protein
LFDTPSKDPTCYRDCTDVDFGLPGGSCSGDDEPAEFHCTDESNVYEFCSSIQAKPWLCTDEDTKACYRENCP